MIKRKAFLAAICIAVLFYSLYGIWRVLEPTQIIAVHDGFHLLVKNPPLTDRGKIEWWQKNKEILKRQYNFPETSQLDNFLVIVWDFNSDYKKMPHNAQELDLACFNDMQTDINCIEKNSIMQISRFDYGRKTRFDIRAGGKYPQEDKSRKIIKVK